jgi:hypothetical protein
LICPVPVYPDPRFLESKFRIADPYSWHIEIRNQHSILFWFLVQNAALYFYFF